MAGVMVALSALSVCCSASRDGSGGPDGDINVGAGGGGSPGGSSSGSGAGTGFGASVSSGGEASGGSPNAQSAGGSPFNGGSSNSGGSVGIGGGGNGAAGSNTAGDSGLAGWTLVWSEEFTGAQGSPPDASKWNMENKGDGFGNGELEYYRNGTNNAVLDGNGSVVITAKKESYMGKSYTSARLESNGKFEHAYGRIETRLKMPKGQGIWPAFWMVGNNIGSVGWPSCGEIDIMENRGREPSINHGSLHGPGYSGGAPLTGSYTLPNGAKFADDFHRFAIEWEVNTIRFYVDEQLYETRTNVDVPAGKKWVYDHPFFIVLNVAVGGQFGGNPDATTAFPQTMTVDYVRVYEK